MYALLPLLLLCYVLDSTHATLVHLHIVHRHGDRSPIHIFPKSQHQKDVWPMGLGQLTIRGMRQHFALGSLLRQLYGNVINESYQLAEIRVRSTDYERTLMSSYCNLAGLYYPQKDSQRWNASMPWVPIPVHTIPTSQDILLIETPCARYDQLEGELVRSPMVQLVMKENKDLFELLERETGLPLPVNISNLWQIQDQLYCEEQHNLSKPSWFTATTRKRLYELNDFGWRLKYYDNELSRLRAGVLLHTIVEHMQEVINGTEQRISGNKVIVYSGHDTDVAALLAVLGIYNGKQPPYASAVLLELHRNDTSKEWFVRTLLHNSSVNEDFKPGQPYLLRLPQCKDYCPFGNFSTMTQPNRLSRHDYKKACQTHPTAVLLKQTSDAYNTVTFLIITLCLFGLGVVLILIVFFICRQKKLFKSADSHGYCSLPKELRDIISDEECSSHTQNGSSPLIQRP